MQKARELYRVHVWIARGGAQAGAGAGGQLGFRLTETATRQTPDNHLVCATASPMRPPRPEWRGPGLTQTGTKKFTRASCATTTACFRAGHPSSQSLTPSQPSTQPRVMPATRTTVVSLCLPLLLLCSSSCAAQDAAGGGSRPKLPDGLDEAWWAEANEHPVPGALRLVAGGWRSAAWLHASATAARQQGSDTRLMSVRPARRIAALHCRPPAQDPDPSAARRPWWWRSSSCSSGSGGRRSRWRWIQRSFVPGAARAGCRQPRPRAAIRAQQLDCHQQEVQQEPY